MIGCAILTDQSGFAKIKDLGKWASNAYIGYIQSPVEYTADYVAL